MSFSNKEHCSLWIRSLLLCIVSWFTDPVVTSEDMLLPSQLRKPNFLTFRTSKSWTAEYFMNHHVAFWVYNFELHVPQWQSSVGVLVVLGSTQCRRHWQWAHEFNTFFWTSKGLKTNCLWLRTNGAWHNVTHCLDVSEEANLPHSLYCWCEELRCAGRIQQVGNISERPDHWMNFWSPAVNTHCVREDSQYIT